MANIFPHYLLPPKYLQNITVQYYLTTQVPAGGPTGHPKAVCVQCGPERWGAPGVVRDTRGKLGNLGQVHLGQFVRPRAVREIPQGWLIPGTAQVAWGRHPWGRHTWGRLRLGRKPEGCWLLLGFHLILYKILHHTISFPNSPTAADIHLIFLFLILTDPWSFLTVASAPPVCIISIIKTLVVSCNCLAMSFIFTLTWGRGGRGGWGGARGAGFTLIFILIVRILRPYHLTHHSPMVPHVVDCDLLGGHVDGLIGNWCLARSIHRNQLLHLVALAWRWPLLGRRVAGARGCFLGGWLLFLMEHSWPPLHFS